MKRQRKNPPGFDKRASDLHEAFSVAKPLGPVTSIVALPDPRKAELERIQDFVVEQHSRGHEGTVDVTLTRKVQTAARRKLNAGVYRDTIKAVLLEFVEDENLHPDTRIRAARAAAEFIPKETKLEIRREEVAEETVEIDLRKEARKKIAAALEALK